MPTFIHDNSSLLILIQILLIFNESKSFFSKIYKLLLNKLCALAYFFNLSIIKFIFISLISSLLIFLTFRYFPIELLSLSFKI